MTNWKTLLAAPAAFGVLLVVSGNAVAAEAVTVESEAAPAVSDVMVAEPIQLAQVTSVSELSDVQPGDWAFTALQRLVEEYGCLEGYPDRTYRGDRALTRYEFAAGLNACLDVVIQLIGTPNEEIEAIKRLQEEFAAELATIRGRTDALETDVAELEANQFSTTTKLRGDVDAHLVIPFGEADLGADAFQDRGSPGIGGPEADATFEYRARLNFDTSFTGEDRLRVRLQASDDAGSLANSEAGLAEQSGVSGGGQDSVSLDDVYYSFPIGNRISGIIAANSVVTDDFVSSTIVPFDGPSVADAGGPEFYDQYGSGNFGAGVNVAFSDNLVLDLGYASEQSNVNAPGNGVFDGRGSYIAQLNLLTDGAIDAAVTYIGGTNATGNQAESTIAGLLNFDLGRFQIGGHYAATDYADGNSNDSYMGGIAVSDFLGAGNELGIYGGISPDPVRDPLLVEAYYQIAVNEFFTFTPAVIYTDSDDATAATTDNVYGALRASFNF
jgi:Carbohydrate-selective porin, OprB family/S-layer homology domain